MAKTTSDRRSEQNGQPFLDRLQQQASLCSRLGQLARRQRELVSKEDTQSLIALLGDRQKLTDDLTTMYEGFGTLQEQWDNVKHTLDQGDRQHAETLINAVRSTIHNVIESDVKDAGLLEVRKRGVADALQAVPTGKAVLSAYGAPGRNESGVRLNKMDQQS